MGLPTQREEIFEDGGIWMTCKNIFFYCGVGVEILIMEFRLLLSTIHRDEDNKQPDLLIDISTAGAIALLIAVVLAGFGAAIGISEEKTWRIMSW